MADASRAGGRLAIAAQVSLALAAVCAVLAFLGWGSDGPLADGASRLLIYPVFLFFDLIAIAAGITLAVLRQSPAWAVVPAAAILMTFLMLFPAFEAFQAVRG